MCIQLLAMVDYMVDYMGRFYYLLINCLAEHFVQKKRKKSINCINFEEWERGLVLFDWKRNLVVQFEYFLVETIP